MFGDGREMLWIEGETDGSPCPVRDGNARSDPLGSGTLLGDIIGAASRDDGGEEVAEGDDSSFNFAKLGKMAERVTGRLQKLSAEDIGSVVGIDSSFTRREVKFLRSIFNGEGLGHHMEDRYYQGMGMCAGYAAVAGRELTPLEQLEGMGTGEIEEAIAIANGEATGGSGRGGVVG